MGHRKYSIPRRGGRGFWPRVRARRFIAPVESYPPYNGPPRLLGFLAYKAGMTIVLRKITRKMDPLYGKDAVLPATVLEAPPAYVLAIVLYEKTPYGLKKIGQINAEIPEELKDHLKRKTSVPKNIDMKKELEKLEELKDRVDEIRVLLLFKPWLTGGVPKKKADLLEVKVGGEVKEALEYAKSILGTDISIGEIFCEGMLVDVLGVTKGKGFQGVVKRFGVKILPRKARKGRRRTGTRGPWTPDSVMFTVPTPGQMGFHLRTHQNLEVLKVVDEILEEKKKKKQAKEEKKKKREEKRKKIIVVPPKEEQTQLILPKSGFPHYGVLKSNYIVLHGSVMGPPKRPITIRFAVKHPVEARIIEDEKGKKVVIEQK